MKAKNKKIKSKVRKKVNLGGNLKKFWNWLWHSNTISSWIVLLLIAFIIVKFVFFPFMGFILKTKLPFVIVESYSMQHCNAIYHKALSSCSFDEYWLNFGSWYENKGFSKEEFRNFPFYNGLNAGDIVILKGKKSYNIGEIIVFMYGKKPIIHRITNKYCDQSCIYETKGDNNPGQLVFETKINESQIIGKAIFRIPKLGWIKLSIFKLLGFA